ncbi:MAG: hypothetical protein LBT79_02820 [Elusimicrobiota bacterium]|nr:hypothetical protein [Elusimicrobiota bacterium]
MLEEAQKSFAIEIREYKLKYNVSQDTAAEEVIADKFIAYANSRQGIIGRIKVLFDRLLNRINKYLGNLDAINDLYADMWGGAFAQRQTNTEKLREAAVYKAAAMYENPRSSIQEFVDFVKIIKDSKKSYFQMKTKKGNSIVIPSDTVIHAGNNHSDLTNQDWENLSDNIDDVNVYLHNNQKPNYRGKVFIGKLDVKDNHYAIIGEYFNKGEFKITTFFKDNNKKIDAWIKQRSSNTLKPLEIQISQLTPQNRVAGEFAGSSPIDNIFENQDKVKYRLDQPHAETKETTPADRKISKTESTDIKLFNHKAGIENLAKRAKEAGLKGLPKKNWGMLMSMAAKSSDILRAGSTTFSLRFLK